MRWLSAAQSPENVVDPVPETFYENHGPLAPLGQMMPHRVIAVHDVQSKSEGKRRCRQERWKRATAWSPCCHLYDKIMAVWSVHLLLDVLFTLFTSSYFRESHMKFKE